MTVLFKSIFSFTNATQHNTEKNIKTKILFVNINKEPITPPTINLLEDSPRSKENTKMPKLQLTFPPATGTP